MVFNLFCQHLEEDSPPVAGKPSGSQAHIISLTPKGAVLTSSGSMTAPPLPQEPQAWGFETPSAKKQYHARSPTQEPLTGPKIYDISVMDHWGVGKDATTGAMKPVPLVQAQDLTQCGVPDVPEVSPSPVATAPPLMADVSVSISVPAPETTRASAAYVSEIIRQRRTKKNQYQNLRRKGNRTGWVAPDDAALKMKAKQLLNKMKLAKKAAAQGTKGDEPTESAEPRDALCAALGLDEDEDVPDMCDESVGSPAAPSAAHARAQGRPKGVKTLTKEAKAKAKKATAAAKAQAKAAAKAKAKSLATKQAKPKAKSNAKAESTSSSSQPMLSPKAKAEPKAKAKAEDVQLEEQSEEKLTFAGRYIKDDENWRSVLEGWDTATGGGLNSDSLQRLYWKFVHNFIKDKPGSYHEKLVLAAKEWAKTPEAIAGRAKRAAVKLEKKDRLAKEKKVRMMAGKVADKDSDDVIPASKNLGDEFDDDDMDGVPAVPARDLGNEFSEDEGTVPLTQPDIEATQAEAEDATVTPHESVAKPTAKAKAKTKAKAKGTPMAMVCEPAAVSEDAHAGEVSDMVESGRKKRKSEVNSEQGAADVPEAVAAAKPSKRCRKPKVMEIPFK